MRIKKMTASFGRLNGETLAPGPGLTIIQAPNEGGKSTWAAFLRAMLYGIPTRERDRQGYLAEKNRYQPWSGAPMEGVLELTWGGRDIIIRRGPKGNTPFGAFEAVDAATGEPVPGLTAEHCGETLLGVPREVWERSAFVGQGGSAIDGTPALEARIAALASSGEEDVSFSQVERRLRDWLNRRRHNKTGLIPKIEEELAEIEDLLARQAGAFRRAGEARMALERLESERAALTKTLAVHRAARDREAAEQYDAAQADLLAAQREEEALAREIAQVPPATRLREAQGDLSYLNTILSNRKLAARQLEEAGPLTEAARAEAESDPLFGGQTPEEAWRRASADGERLRAHKRTGGPLAAGVICLAAALALAGAGLFGPEAWRLIALAAVPAAAVGVVLLVRTIALKRRQEAESAALGRRYGTVAPDEILDLANAYREKWTAAEEAARREESIRASLADLDAQREQLTRSLLALVHPFAPGVKDLFGVSAAISKALTLEVRHAAALVKLEGARKLADSLPRPENSGSGEPGAAPAGDPAELAARLSAVEGEMARLRGEYARAEGEWSALGDPDALRARREELTEQLAARGAEYEALGLALEGLAAAHGDLQARFSPALNREAGALMEALTGGKYRAVTLGRDFEALAQEADAVLPRRSLALSQGTADQLYLAVRLAVCRLVLPAEDPGPLVLDDALAAFDDARMALALELLAGLGRERQILLFTCHSREGAWAEGRTDTAVLPLVK